MANLASVWGTPEYSIYIKKLYMHVLYAKLMYYYTCIYIHVWCTSLLGFILPVECQQPSPLQLLLHYHDKQCYSCGCVNLYLLRVSNALLMLVHVRVISNKGNVFVER
jgi:hypothetical protein